MVYKCNNQHIENALNSMIENKYCEDCEYFNEHPFIREGDNTDYCDLTDKEVDAYQNICDRFKEMEY